MSDILNHYRDQLLQELAQVMTLPTVTEQAESESEVIKLQRPSLQLDESCLKRDAENIANEEAFNKFMQQIYAAGFKEATGVAGVKQFIESANKLLSGDQGGSSGERLAKINLIRVLYNLVSAKETSGAGFQFERFLALLCDGKVIPPTSVEKTNGLQNISDITFDNDPLVSIKLIQKGGNIKGSIRNMIYTLTDPEINRDGNSVLDYIVCEKPGDKDKEKKVVFHRFLISLASMSNLPGKAGESAKEALKSYRLAKAKRKRKSTKNTAPTAGDLGDMERHNIRVSLGALRDAAKKLPDEDIDIKGLKNITKIRYEELGSVDLSNTLEISNALLQVVNEDFDQLLLNLQNLTKAINTLTYGVSEDPTDDDEPGYGEGEKAKKAKKADDKAKATKDTTTKIKKTYQK